MSYHYDVFISYPHHGEWVEWVELHFLTIFKHYLGEELPGAEDRVFIDKEGIRPGDSWPFRLQKALTQSKVLVPLWSPQYFNREWCKKELAHMLARETHCQLRTQVRPEGLIFPAALHDGNSFPEITKNIQYVGLQEYSNVWVARNSVKRESLAECVKIWVRDIAWAVNRAPIFDPTWEDLSCTEFLNKIQCNPSDQSEIPSIA